jgi:hypothetical protein
MNCRRGHKDKRECSDDCRHRCATYTCQEPSFYGIARLGFYYCLACWLKSTWWKDNFEENFTK